MKPYSHLFFDLDGTLTNPKEGITRSVEYALHTFGIQVENRDSLCCFIGPPLVESFQTYYHFTPEQAQQGLIKYRERFSKIGIWENRPYPGIKRMLSSLKKAGKVLAVATSKPTVFANRILKRFGYLEYFDFVSGSELDGTHNQKYQVIAAAVDHAGKGIDHLPHQCFHFFRAGGYCMDMELVFSRHPVNLGNGIIFL